MQSHCSHTYHAFKTHIRPALFAGMMLEEVKQRALFHPVTDKA
jgi:hypothetical protein